MRRLIALLLTSVLLLTGYIQPNVQAMDMEWNEIQQEYSSLSDENLLHHVEDLVYNEAVQSLNSDEYFVENVSAVYISKEYLDEIAFNSQSNIYFGYSLAELDDLFEGSRYIFTLGNDGQTTVQELETLDDNITNEMLKDVAIGMGVILVCVTVSAITAGTGAPVVSMVFAASAKTGTAMALSSGGLGAVSAGVVKGIQTGDLEEAMKAAAIAGGEGFKWGAISGVATGGASASTKYAKALKKLKGKELNGLTRKQAALIQAESGYPVDVLKQFKNMKQYNICKKARLSPKMVNGKNALVRKINLNYLDDMGRTNLERMKLGLAALDDTGIPYELHHIGQEANSTLAILTKAEHMKGGNNKIWHELGKATKVHGAGNTWDTQRKLFWEAIAESVGGV